MVLGMSLATFTMVHVIISMIGIVSGIIVMFAMLGSHRLSGLTAIFLLSTVLTSATGWLDGCGVTLDRGGFVVTGAQSDLHLGRAASSLETSVPGVFAVGDVRSGSVKRVGGAIGEGAQVVAALHGFLGDAAKPAL